MYANVEFGKDITLDDLLPRYDAILFATGAVEDKPLNIPGSSLCGVYGAAKFVEWYDGYPTSERTWPLDASEVTVIGGGNVAMDVARELLRDADYLREHTDISDDVYNGLLKNQAKTLHLFIRRGVAQAKFSVQELREMEKLSGVQIVVNENDFDLDDETIDVAGKDKLTRQMVEELFAIRDLSEDMEDGGNVDFEGNPASRRYIIHFNSDPVEILGEDGRVRAIRVERTVTSADGKMTRTGEFEEYPVQAVYHAIGYKPAKVSGVAYDENKTLLANKDGRIVTDPDGDVVRPRLYATGWAKRGPVGLIGSTKSDALQIVANMLEDLAAGDGDNFDGDNSKSNSLRGRFAEDREPKSIENLLASRGVDVVDFDGWKRVDDFEVESGMAENRARKKVVSKQMLIDIANHQQ